jgi:hypothetical protein
MKMIENAVQGGEGATRTLAKGTAVRIAKFMNDQMNEMSKDELYEAAAECRDISRTFGSYALGYGNFQDIEQLLFDMLKMHGEIVGIDSKMRVTFKWLGIFFDYHCALPDFTACANIYHDQAKKKMK